MTAAGVLGNGVLGYGVQGNGVLAPSSKLESPTPIITIINPTPIPGLFIPPTSKALESPHQCRPKIRKISNKKTQMR